MQYPLAIQAAAYQLQGLAWLSAVLYIFWSGRDIGVNEQGLEACWTCVLLAMGVKDP